MSAFLAPRPRGWSGFVAASGRFPGPPPVRFVAVSGQNLMAPDTPFGGRRPTPHVQTSEPAPTDLGSGSAPSEPGLPGSRGRTVTRRPPPRPPAAPSRSTCQRPPGPDPGHARPPRRGGDGPPRVTAGGPGSRPLLADHHVTAVLRTVGADKDHLPLLWSPPSMCAVRNFLTPYMNQRTTAGHLACRLHQLPTHRGHALVPRLLPSAQGTATHFHAVGRRHCITSPSPTPPQCHHG